MLHGWIVLDKPLGLGSTTAVSAVKRILRQAGEPRTKVGHGGTLDPLASGVLPIALGEATKVAGRMLDATKVYEFTIGFGAETDTLDGEGAVIATSDVRPTEEQVAAILARFTGPIEQVPPAYSALKIQGKPVKGSRVMLLGMAYKKDVDDPRESPGFELMDLLLKKGAAVTYNDPHVPTLPRMRNWPHLKMDSTPLTPETLAAQDCVLIVTDHSAYDYPTIVRHAKLVVDTRNATRTVAAGREKIIKA